MNEEVTFAQGTKPPSSLEPGDPGAKLIRPDTTADTLAMTKEEQPCFQRPLRIVSVDDEKVRLQMVEIVISRYFNGVTVQSFQDPEKAWHELSRTDPDLLITDDIMGKLNGEEIVRRLANRKVTYPIIVINAYGPERELWVSDCAKRGEHVTMLSAPYEVEVLVRALESGLKLSRDTTGSVEIPTKLPKTRPPRIVVVDDEPMWLEMFKVLIDGWFKDVTLLLFSNSDEAWQEVAREGPDLLVLNIPATGLEMLPLLASHKVKYPVVLTSGYAEEVIRPRADPNLIISFLSKPFSAKEVFQELLLHVGPSDNPKCKNVKDSL